APHSFATGYSGSNGRQHPKSTGLGLYLVKHNSEKLGQKGKLESKLGEGTSGKVYFIIESDPSMEKDFFEAYRAHTGAA
ncbi:hypothetical protein VJI94_08775, partial [Parvimonas sp. D9]|nr:hypothetical protein [Parvimonas sp. D9]